MQYGWQYTASRSRVQKCCPQLRQRRCTAAGSRPSSSLIAGLLRPAARQDQPEQARVLLLGGMPVPIILLSREPAKERVLAVVEMPGHLSRGRVDAHQPAPVVVPGLVVGMAGQMGRITGGEIGHEVIALVVDGGTVTHRWPSCGCGASCGGAVWRVHG